MREAAEEVKSAVREAAALADRLVRRLAVWIVGGDGWAYDIGSAGRSTTCSPVRRDVNVPAMLDTEVYPNTGGRCRNEGDLGPPPSSIAGRKDRH